MLLLIAPGCDFDIPEKFEMPTWFLDIKIPLVQQRYQMEDISDTSNNIYPTEDSLGFQIVYQADLPYQSIDPENLKVDFPGGYKETEIPATEIPGIPLDQIPSIPPISISPETIPAEIPGLTDGGRINLVDHTGQLFYIDTTTELNPITGEPLCYPYPSGEYCGTRFTFPITEKKVVSADFYNNEIIGNVNIFLENFFNAQNNLPVTSLPLNTIAEGSDLISSVDTLNIAAGEGSKFAFYLKNRGIPTDIVGIYSRIDTGTDSLDLSLANFTSTGLSNGAEPINESQNLYGKGLAQLFALTQYFSIEPQNIGVPVELFPSGSLEGIPSDSMYLDFKTEFGLEGFESIDISVDSSFLDVPKPEIPFPATENDDGSSTKLELYSAVLESQDVPYESNRLQIYNLVNTLPFKIDFLMDYKNFYIPQGNDPVKVDVSLIPDSIYTFNISLEGDTMRAANPDSAIKKLDVDLVVGIPAQKVTLPLDGSSLGGLGLTIRFGSLVFNKLQALIEMGFPSVPQEQELPQGLDGVTIADVKVQIIMKSQLRLPIRMNMDFTGVDMLGDTTRMLFSIDTIGFPPTSADTATTIIELNRFGTRIKIYETTFDTNAVYDTIVPPPEGQGTIIDLMASNPTSLTIDAAARIDGRGEIEAGKGLGGAFRLEAPFSLILEETVIMSQSTVIEEMDYSSRNTIRNSLISADMVFDITNALPIGAELATLLSNIEYFPTSRKPEDLELFRDTMAVTQGWDTTDVVYIVDNCEDLHPSSSNKYIYNVMTDFNECVEGMPYIVRSDGGAIDTVISYVDTLFKFILPNPNRLYTDDDTLDYPVGMVAEPGYASYASVLDTNRVRLITDYGDHYVAPRFQINSTDSQIIFLSINDYLEVGSFINFRISSSGAFAPANSELVIVKPNGGQTLYTDQTYDIQWRTYGEGISAVDLYYSVSSDSNISAAINGYWTGTNGGVIAEDITNVDGLNTYEWSPPSSLADQDSVRIRIVSNENIVLDPKTKEYVKATDINGWYLKIRNPGRTNMSSRGSRGVNRPERSRSGLRY